MRKVYSLFFKSLCCISYAWMVAYDKRLEMCMFVYLDEFLDYHRKLFPQDATTFGTDGIKKLLEASYQAIREKIREDGLLTEKAAGEYMRRKK